MSVDNVPPELRAIFKGFDLRLKELERRSMKGLDTSTLGIAPATFAQDGTFSLAAGASHDETTVTQVFDHGYAFLILVFECSFGFTTASDDHLGALFGMGVDYGAGPTHEVVTPIVLDEVITGSGTNQHRNGTRFASVNAFNQPAGTVVGIVVGGENDSDITIDFGYSWAVYGFPGIT